MSRIILNFNRYAAELLGTNNTALELTSGSTKRRGPYVLVTANTGNGPAFSRVSPDSHRFKTRISVDEAKDVGLKTSKRYTLERRGNTERFYLVPHSTVRGSKPVRISEPAVTVCVTESS